MIAPVLPGGAERDDIIFFCRAQTSSYWPRLAKTGSAGRQRDGEREREGEEDGGSRWRAVMDRKERERKEKDKANKTGFKEGEIKDIQTVLDP